MKSLTSRRAAGATLLAALVAIWSLSAVPALAELTELPDGPQYPNYEHPGGICPDGQEGWSGHFAPGAEASGEWGSGVLEGSFVTVDIENGYTLLVCTKGGNDRSIFEVTGTEDVPFAQGSSHWSYKVIEEPDDTTTTTEAPTTTTEAPTTTTEAPTTTTEAPTTTTEAPTTTTEAPTTTTTEPEVSSTSTSSTTSTTEADTTTSTEPEVAPTTIQQTSTTGGSEDVDDDEDTDDTLPFTGVDSDDMAMVALVALAAGSGLLLLTRKSNEARGAHRA